MRKKKQTPPPKPLNYHITESEFLEMCIAYESGKMAGDDILIYFGHIIESRDLDRFGYPWLVDLLKFGVISDQGLINPQKLKEYKQLNH